MITRHCHIKDLGSLMSFMSRIGVDKFKRITMNEHTYNHLAINHQGFVFGCESFDIELEINPSAPDYIIEYCYEEED